MWADALAEAQHAFHTYSTKPDEAREHRWVAWVVMFLCALACYSSAMLAFRVMRRALRICTCVIDVWTEVVASIWHICTVDLSKDFRLLFVYLVSICTATAIVYPSLYDPIVYKRVVDMVGTTVASWMVTALSIALKTTRACMAVLFYG